MARTRQQASKSKSTEESGTVKKQRENTPTREEADQTAHKCRPKKYEFQEAEADNEVMDALYKLAKSGKSSTAAIFWAKTRCGMQEKGQEKKRQVSQIPAIVIKSIEEGKQA